MLTRFIAPLAALLSGLVALGVVAPSPAHAARQATPYDVVPFTTTKADNVDLARAWHAWKARHHGRYTTLVTRSCECLEEPPTRTTVRRGEVTSVTYDGSEEQLGTQGWEMDELFRLIRRGHREADRVQVRYVRGVPRSIYIDWDEGLADEETILGVDVVDTDRAEHYDYAFKPFRLEPSDRPALKRAWRAWQGSDLAREYATTVRRVAGEGSFPVLRTEVKRGVVLAVERADDSTGPLPKRGYPMDRLFRELRGLYRHADELHVSYTADGVPRRISADPIKEAVDDEFVLTVKVGGVIQPD